MYLVVIAWMYVVLMMSAAEAMNSQGTVLGAIVTFLLYGALPLSIVIYVMRTPARRRQRLAREAAEREQEAATAAGSGSGGPSSGSPESRQPSLEPSALDPDGGGHAAGDPIPPVRKEE